MALLMVRREFPGWAAEKVKCYGEQRESKLRAKVWYWPATRFAGARAAAIQRSSAAGLPRSPLVALRAVQAGAGAFGLKGRSVKVTNAARANVTARSCPRAACAGPSTLRCSASAAARS